MLGRAVLTPIRPPLERDQQIVQDSFHCIDSSQAVRDMVAEYEVAEYDVRQVIIGTGFIIPSMKRTPGLTALLQSRSRRATGAQ